MLLTHFVISATQIFIIFKAAESHLLKTVFSRECCLLLLLIFFFLKKLLYSSFFFNLLVNRTDVFWMSISTSYNKFPRFIKKVKLASLYLFHQVRITHISWKDLYVCVWVFILTHELGSTNLSQITKNIITVGRGQEQEQKEKEINTH